MVSRRACRQTNKQMSDVLLKRSDLYSPVRSNLSRVGPSSKHKQYSNMNLARKDFFLVAKEMNLMNIFMKE